MNKWKCVDCVRRDTDACHFLGVEDGYKYCENVLVDVDYAYEKGRADKYQEIVSEYMLLTEVQVNQIRADAIEKFADILINPNNYERYDFDDCITDSNKANDFFKYVFDMAEQLKEQNF